MIRVHWRATPGPLLLLFWACYVMGWEGGVYSQEDGTQVLQQGDLVWV